MTEFDERELFIRRTMTDLQTLWLGHPEKSFDELIIMIGPGDDGTFSGNLIFELEQYLEGE